MNDLRVKRTYILLKNALFELLAHQSFEEIKVNDICNLAMVHRTTFYSHFSDKYELLEYCIKDVEDELTQKIKYNKYSLNVSDVCVKRSSKESGILPLTLAGIA